MNVVLRCKTAPSLKLGPNDEIVFNSGFATVDTDKFPSWEKWATYPGQPHIDILGNNDEGQVPVGAVNSEVCDICECAFDVSKGDAGFKSHMRSHYRRYTEIRPPGRRSGRGD